MTEDESLADCTMTRTICSLLCFFAAIVPALAQEKKIAIRWHGQSFFHYTMSDGTRIVFDPHAIEQYPRTMVQADLVLVSHPHFDHNVVDVVTNKDKAKILTGVKRVGNKQEWNRVDDKFREIKIYSVNTFHDKDSGMSRGRNSCFVLEADGLRICHLGDLGHALSERQLQSIGEIDILMIPVGGIYTINGEDARAIVAQIKPKHLILPMHYGTTAFEDLVGPQEFLEGLKNIEKKLTTNEYDFVLGAPKPETPKIVLLSWKKGGD